MSRFIMPHQMHAFHGDYRHVGVEMEMGGLQLSEIARAVTDVFGGTAISRSSFEIDIENARHGSFRVELDASLLKDHEYRRYLALIGIDQDDPQTQHRIDDLLVRLAGTVVPSEVIAPPVRIAALEEMDNLRLCLHQAGAKGTRAALVYAFAVQFNVEAAELKAGYLLDILRAFVLLYESGSTQERIDISRKILPFIRAFPGDYVRAILAENYNPDMTELIRDYLRHNATRNRPLDMLPLFAHLNRDQVMAADVETHLIKPRPTFHYRLPNCRIDEPDWSLAQPWNDWVLVEHLAADKERLREHSRAYLENPLEVVAARIDDWADKVRKWIKK
ncbi:amidoligase family protein [Desulfonatronum thiosulfatophilum]|nr:amidoligase family protein [Desulfonatronum thiosulfatophilum]